jgi:hypothetical protein
MKDSDLYVHVRTIIISIRGPFSVGSVRITRPKQISEEWKLWIPGEIDLDPKGEDANALRTKINKFLHQQGVTEIFMLSDITAFKTVGALRDGTRAKVP